MEIKDLTQEQKNLLNEINTTETYKGKSNLTAGNAYNITMTRNGVKIGFIFNDNIYNESDKDDFIYSLLRDSQAYEYCYNFANFMSEFGYTDAKQAQKAYTACKKQNERLHKLFNNTEIKMLEKIFQDY